MAYSNKEKKREYDKKYRELNREKKREIDRRYRELNREKIADYKRKHREENKEKIADYKRKYREENREYVRELRRKYYQLNKEKRQEQDKAHRDERRAYCVEYLGGKCVKCGDIHNLQFDHIKREGKKYNIASRLTLKLDNLKEELDKCQILCAPCHLDKTAKEWITQRGDGQSVCIV